MSCLHSAHGSRLPSWPLLPRWPPEQAWWHGSVYITRPLWSNAGDCWSVTVGWSNAGLRSVTWPPLRRSCPRYLTCTRGTARFTTCGGYCTSSRAMYTVCGTIGHVYFMWYAWLCISLVVCIVQEVLPYTSYVVHTCARAEVWFGHARSHGWKSHHLATAFTCSTYLVKCHLSQTQIVWANTGLFHFQYMLKIPEWEKWRSSLLCKRESLDFSYS